MQILWPLLTAILVNIYVSLLLFWRYEGKLGYSFLISSLIVFSIPVAVLVFVPLYLILGADVAIEIRLFMTAAMYLLYFRLLRRLKARLSKWQPRSVSPPAKPQAVNQGQGGARGEGCFEGQAD